MTTAASLIASLPAFDWRARILGGYFRKWVVLGVLIGIVAGVGAIVFFKSIDIATQLFLGDLAGLTPPVPAGEGSTLVTSADRRWLLPAIVTLGGLLSGLIVFSLAPEAEGHGTDAAIDAFHHKGGRIRSRIPPIKLVASAITIGSGGSAGREGPTAQIAAGFGSWLGDAFRLTPQDRRIAVAVGMGAGIGAIFKAPLGGAILSAEILYIRDFELDAIIPGFIASVIGYAIFGAWSGWTPVFGNTTGLTFTHPESLVWYAVLGLLAGVGGIAYAKTFYGTRDAFHRLRIPPHFKPAIGGLCVGVIAIWYPQVLSMGYGWVQLGIDGNTAELATGTMLALVVLKIVATSLTIGSGGSGGVFAPGLFVGGMLGGGMWGALHTHVPWMPETPAPFVIVGMMALFGGVAKAPIAVMLMVAEMTGEFSMLVPAMIATSIAYLVSGNVGIYESQVPSRADSPAHRGEFTVPLIQALTVGQSMRTDPLTAAPDDAVADAERRLAEFGRRGMPVLDGGRLVGMFTMMDALRASRSGHVRVADAMSKDLVVAYPADSLHTALQRMARSGLSLLPVVDRENANRLAGILDMRDIATVLDAEVSAISTRPQRAGEPADDPLRVIRVGEVMNRKFDTVPSDLTIKRLANRLASADRHAALVVDDEGALVAIVTHTDVERAIEDDTDRPLAEIAVHNVIVARANQTVAEALAQPGAEGLRQLPVVEPQDGHLVPVGLLRRSDVVAAYLRSRDRQSRIARRAAELADHLNGHVSTVEVRITRGSAAVHKTLAELRLPHDAVVTAVLRGDVVVIPRGQVRLESGDRVQILASAEARPQVLQRFSMREPQTTQQSGPA
jgi:CIC family chloride channel protein